MLFVVTLLVENHARCIRNWYVMEKDNLVCSFRNILSHFFGGECNRPEFGARISDYMGDCGLCCRAAFSR
jgi:phage baseplate assembly protein W